VLKNDDEHLIVTDMKTKAVREINYTLPEEWLDLYTLDDPLTGSHWIAKDHLKLITDHPTETKGEYTPLLKKLIANLCIKISLIRSKTSKK